MVTRAFRRFDLQRARRWLALRRDFLNRGAMVSYRQGLDQPLRGLDEPVLLDEWQEVPEVMGAVRRSVDGDPRPGRFLLMAAPGPAAPRMPGRGSDG